MLFHKSVLCTREEKKKKKRTQSAPPSAPPHPTPKPSPPSSALGMSDMSPVTAGTKIFYLHTAVQFISHAFLLRLRRAPSHPPHVCNPEKKKKKTQRRMRPFSLFRKDLLVQFWLDLKPLTAGFDVVGVNVQRWLRRMKGNGFV